MAQAKQCSKAYYAFIVLFLACLCSVPLAQPVDAGASMEEQETSESLAINTEGAVTTHLSAAQLHVLVAVYDYSLSLQNLCAEALETYHAGRQPALPSCLTVEILKSTDVAHEAIRGIAQGRSTKGFDQAVDSVLDPLEIDFFSEVVQLSKEHSAFAVLASHVAAEERTLLGNVKRVAKLMTYTADRARTTDKQSWVDALFVTRSMVGQVNRSVNALQNFTAAGIHTVQQALKNTSASINDEQVLEALDSSTEFGNTFSAAFDHLKSVIVERMEVHQALLVQLNGIYKDVLAGTLAEFPKSSIPDAFWDHATGFSEPEVHQAPDILLRINYEIEQVLRPRKAQRVQLAKASAA